MSYDKNGMTWLPPEPSPTRNSTLESEELHPLRTVAFQDLLAAV